MAKYMTLESKCKSKKSTARPKKTPRLVADQTYHITRKRIEDILEQRELNKLLEI